MELFFSLLSETQTKNLFSHKKQHTLTAILPIFLSLLLSLAPLLTLSMFDRLSVEL